MIAGGRPPTLEQPPVVRWLDPPDGATGIFRDAPVVATLSHPADPASVHAGTFQVEERGRGPLAGTLALSPDGGLVVWTAREPLAPGVEHLVFACGLRDRHGREVSPWLSRFVPCAFTMEGLLTLDDTDS